MAVPTGLPLYPTQAQLRDNMLGAIAHYCAEQGITANVLKNSDAWIKCHAVAGQLQIAIANGAIGLEATNPLTAQGDALIKFAALYGVFPRPPSASTCFSRVGCVGVVNIPAGFVATADDGTRFAVDVATTCIAGTPIALTALSGGASTNQAPGTNLQWENASIAGLFSRTRIDANGAVDGSDGDVTLNPDGSKNVEKLRARLLRKMANPGVGGNPSQCVDWAEQSSAAVEAAYVYSAARGPSSYDIAVTRAGTDRTLSVTTTNRVLAFVTSQMPGSESINVTSISPEPLDVVLSASLPLPAIAGGAGGGWRDANPFPAEITKCTSFNSATGEATLNSTAAPQVGSHIGVWNPSATDANGDVAPKMVEFVVSSVTGGVGAWVITVQNGFGFSPLAQYVSAGAEKLVQYAADFAAQVGKLGPGEKTSNPDILERARRFPGTEQQAPNAVTSRLLSALTERVDATTGAQVYPEISDLQYAARYTSGTTGTKTAPSVPLTTGDPPYVLTLASLAIIKA